MNHKIAHVPVIIFLATLLSACGANDPSGVANSIGSESAGNNGCVDRSTKLGIEGGGLRRLIGGITDIGNDDTLVVGCQPVSARNAVVVVEGEIVTLRDLEVGQIVEVLGRLEPQSGDLQAERITGKVEPDSHGRYVGTVTIGGVDYFGDALLTVDGAIRLHVGGPYSATGALQSTRPETSAQFVGTLQVQGSDATGNGVVIGQGCASAAPIRFCNGAAPAEIRVFVNANSVEGELQVSTNAGEETWLLNLDAWSNYYLLSAERSYLAGSYRELIAEFNVGADLIMSIDSDGRLFFQSAPSDCVANGTLEPHLDGSFNVYDVELTLASCTGLYAYLNGAYEGFATTTPGSVWDYDVRLRVWLSKADGAPPTAAVTLLGDPL